MNRIIIILLALITFGCQYSENNVEKSYPNGLFQIKEYGKWGYINSKGEKIIKCQFNEALEFSEGFAPVLVDTLWGFIDTTSNVVIEPKFKQVSGFSCGLSNVSYLSDTGIVSSFIKTDGTTSFISKYKNISAFAFDRATVEIDSEVCVIDKSGNIVFNTHYPHGGGNPLYEGVVQVWGNGEWVQEGYTLFSGNGDWELAHVWKGDPTSYFDKNGRLLIEIQGSISSCRDFKDGVALIQDSNNNKSYINKEGKTAVTPQRPELTYFDFSDGLARVTISGANHKSGFIDKTGKIVIPIQYSWVYDFKEGLAAFSNSLYLGFINKVGDTVISPQFESVDDDGFKNGLCKVKKDRQWGYINHKGKFVWKSQIDIQYKKIDLSNWQLDTLETKTSMYGGKYAGYDNKPREANFGVENHFYLKVDTSDITVFKDKYYGHKICLINGTKDTVYIPAQDGKIKLIQQAINDKKEWQDIENFANSFCGNSYHTVQLLPKFYQIYAAPITKGGVETTLRFKLELQDTVIYSNEYYGAIDKGQFLRIEDKNKTRISVWAN